jgi:DNA-binding transcriptional regulator LsrR (DeoR family)
VNNKSFTSEIQRMVQVARLYYDSGLTQQEIARKLGTTRQNIARLLTAAREAGIVRISIYDPTPDDPYLSDQLRQTFNLNEVVLASSEGLDSNLLRSQLGLAAAQYLTSVLAPDSLVGIGWGRTLYEVVNSFSGERQVPVHVIPMIGGIGDLSPFFQVNELARRMAEAFGGTFRYIYAPAFTQDPVLLESMTRTREVEQMTELWKHLDIAVTGIGHVEFQKISSMFFAEHISPDVLAELESHGAVGDICGRFFKISGEVVTAGAGVIGIAIEQLRTIPEVVAVAGGLEKVRAILGVLRGGYIKTLVTDTATAQAVLIENERGGD